MGKNKVIAIVGGGAAGFFTAIVAAEEARKHNKNVEICILEASGSYLKKVRISGGGRCNVTHHCFEVKDFCKNYPRGQRELLSPMQRFQARDTVSWFKEKGIRLVAESDGRMFPDTNSSETIINCYLQQVQKHRIRLMPNSVVKSIEVQIDQGFKISIGDTDTLKFDALMIATGSAPGGYKLAQSLGHKISERAPSLFSFKIKDPLIADLPGLSFNTSLKLTLPDKKVFKQIGPSLITHWGLSGPAILKLSAWAAREMKSANYQGVLSVNWLGETRLAEVELLINRIKNENAKSHLKNSYPEVLQKRFWLSLLAKLNIDGDKQWANLSKADFNSICQALVSTQLQVSGQNRYKDEFVECGGVSLPEIDFKTMQSKIHPGLYFAGEILDIDGITGGFNFQNAWTTGWVAANHMIL